MLVPNCRQSSIEDDPNPAYPKPVIMARSSRCPALIPAALEKHATPFFGHVHRTASLDGPRRGGVYVGHEHRRPPLPSLVAHLLTRWPVRFALVFIVQGPPSQAVLLCPVWRSLGKFRKRNT